MTRRLASILAFVLAVALGTAAAVYDVADVPDVHRADRTQFVADPDGYIPAAQRDSLNAMLSRVRSTTSVEPMIAVVGAIPADTDIDTYATDLFSRWGLGKADKDNGLLIVVAVDSRKVAIRTGYGVEGVLPDITCGRIIRNTLRPAFRSGDYGGGLIAATAQISRILTDPEYAAELRSGQADADSRGAAADDDDPFKIYIWCACGLTALLLVVWLCMLLNVRRRSPADRYRALAPLRPVLIILSFAGLGIPLLVTIPYLLVLNHWRNHRRKCPRCGTGMKKVDEVNDNRYLTPSQDLEEQIGSVDYDVWLCPNCGETDIVPFVNPQSQWVECDNCHARTARLTVDRIVQRPTSRSEGVGVREYECLNCHHRQRRTYKIERDSSADALAALGAAAILGGRGGGGGGFSGPVGGGFGGGMTGGGGASGSW